MAKEDYNRALQAAKKELEKLLKERAEIDSRIGRLKQTVDSLSSLCDETDFSDISGVNISRAVMPPPTVGISYGVRQALLKSIVPLAPPAIRDSLVKAGYPMDYASELTVIYNTLTRLERQGEAIRTENGWMLTPKGRQAASSPGRVSPPPGAGKK